MIRRSSLSLLAALLMSAATVAQTPSPSKYTILDLGTLGGTYSHGLAINTAGQVTGNASLPGDSSIHAFRSDGTTMTDLGNLGGASSYSAAINTAGQVTGYAWLRRGFRDPRLSVGRDDDDRSRDLGGGV